MKTVGAVVIALLLAAPRAVAQSALEADMRDAAAAYERKDMATAARLWKVWADKGNAEARTLLGAMYWSGEGVPATTRKRHGSTCWRQTRAMPVPRTTSASCWVSKAPRRTTTSRPMSACRSP